MKKSDTMELINKVYEIIDLFNESKEVNEFLNLKEEIKKEPEIKTLLKQIKENDNIYTKEYIELKRRLLTNEKVKQYKKIENDLYFLSLDMNKKLKKINEKKSCGL